MQTIVTTASGSVYLFKEMEGKTHVTRNYMTEGILAEAVEIVPNKPLRVSIYQLNSYNYSQSSDITTYSSTPVVKVEIIA